LYTIILFLILWFLAIITIHSNARIGLASEDLKNTIEKTLGGAGVALLSPSFFQG